MTPDPTAEVRSFETAILAYWEAKRDTAWMADVFGMEEGEVAAILARLLEAHREVATPSVFVPMPRRKGTGRWPSSRVVPFNARRLERKFGLAS
jgi:hypothetical protein